MNAAQVNLTFQSRNPDVLTCISNLSNDEVFTPPELANNMLDGVAKAWAEANDGADIWQDETVTFLDPFTKSGVFLRELTSRLIAGLEEKIPDLQERVDHILKNQVFGIGITQLTSMLARRSLYCSKYANGAHSVTRAFDAQDGNIWFERLDHTWYGGDEVVTTDEFGNLKKKVTNGRCKYCNASQREYDRGPNLESHAYAFIHADDIKLRMAELFGDKMQFDVIVGNPPYQLSDGGQGASAVPIYNKFVDQAKALEPRFLTMVIPARWFFGGRGLDAFRRSMLQDRHIRRLVDYMDSRQAFDGVDVAGGVCYFLRDRENEGDCEIVSVDKTGHQSTTTRPLLEPGADVFVRNNEALSILRKVVLKEAGEHGVVLPAHLRFERQVSGQRPFGLRTYFRGAEHRKRDDDVEVLQAGGRGWAPRASITEGRNMIDKWKVFTSKSSSEHAGQADKNGMRRVLSLSGILPPGSVCTETYVILGVFDTEDEARNCLSYATSKFFRFLVATRTSAQDLPRSAYSFVPILDYSRSWSDSALQEHYNLDDADVELIDSQIRAMEVTG